jgi:hypothetical protein
MDTHDEPTMFYFQNTSCSVLTVVEQVSGQRLWGWAQARFGTASAFLDRFWVHNYCPLMFMETSGK